MAIKLLLLFAVLAAVNAAYVAGPAYSAYSYGAPYAYNTPAIVSQHGNILRTHGNLGQLSTYSKSISTPYSSVTKYDTRLSNNALAYSPYTHGYGYAAAPIYSHAYSAPAYTHNYVTPAYTHGYAAPAYGIAAHAPASLLGVSYSAAPAAAHFSYSNGYGLHYAY